MDRKVSTVLGANGTFEETILTRKKMSLQRVEAYGLLLRSEKLKISLHHVSILY